MNERIYELATQAGAYCETYLYGGDPKPAQLDHMDLEKFALLIVQESVATLEHRYKWAGDADGTEVKKCILQIKQHFGVA